MREGNVIYNVIAIILSFIRRKTRIEWRQCTLCHFTILAFARIPILLDPAHNGGTRIEIENRNKY